jgi:phosphatidylglycerophosphate synthase
MSTGLTLIGWTVGIGCGAVTSVALSRGLARTGADRLGPADWVTLTRASLAGAVAGLVAQSFSDVASVPMLVGLASVALALDAVDGQVARRTGTVSELGARFDMEADAFLILVLSVYVAVQLGWWVLAIGAARYLFVATAWFVPWMRRPLRYRYWRKVTAAAQGIVLTTAASGLLPRPASTLLVLVAAALLAESFGRDVRWLYRHRREPLTRPARPEVATDAATTNGGRS